MKKIILAILLTAGSTAVFAQTKTAEAYNATEASRQMYNDLQLNEAQYLKVRQINQVKQDRMRDMEALYRNDPQMMDQKRAALNAELDSEYRAVLRPDQMDMYLASDGRETTNMNSGGSMTIGSETETMSTDQETKIKTSDTKIKSETGESKIKSGDTKIKSENGESKVKTEHTKTKNEKDKYKHQDSRDNSKVKVTDDKLKIENKDSKIKVEDDKVKIKSRD